MTVSHWVSCRGKKGLVGDAMYNFSYWDLELMILSY